MPRDDFGFERPVEKAAGRQSSNPLDDCGPGGGAEVAEALGTQRRHLGVASGIPELRGVPTIDETPDFVGSREVGAMCQLGPKADVDRRALQTPDIHEAASRGGIEFGESKYDGVEELDGRCDTFVVRVGIFDTGVPHPVKEPGMVAAKSPGEAERVTHVAVRGRRRGMKETRRRPPRGHHLRCRRWIPCWYWPRWESRGGTTPLVASDVRRPSAGGSGAPIWAARDRRSV